MPITLSHPTTSPTTTVVIRASFGSLTNVQTTPVQHMHVAQGGASFVFSPGGATVVQNTILPIDIVWLHEADIGAEDGYASLRAFVITTLEWSKNLCTLTDSDSTSYTVRYVRGLDSMQEVQQGRFSGQLLFRVEPS